MNASFLDTYDPAAYNPGCLLVVLCVSLGLALILSMIFADVLQVAITVIRGGYARGRKAQDTEDREWLRSKFVSWLTGGLTPKKSGQVAAFIALTWLVFRYFAGIVGTLVVFKVEVLIVKQWSYIPNWTFEVIKALFQGGGAISDALQGIIAAAGVFFVWILGAIAVMFFLLIFLVAIAEGCGRMNRFMDQVDG